MRVFVAGGTGALGRRLVPLLVASGHEVVVLTRSPARAEWLQRAGATAVVGDALDRDAVMEAVVRAEPEVVVHELTAFSKLGTNLRRFEPEVARRTGFAPTAPTSCGTPCSPPARGGSSRRASPAGRTPATAARSRPKQIRSTRTRRRRCEERSLRFAITRTPFFLYVREIRRRRFPVVGDDAAVWSFVHIDDVARATIAAIERGKPGVYNLSTTSRPRSRSGCPSWPRRSARNRRVACPCGSAG
jgi:hypothetical protein